MRQTVVFLGIRPPGWQAQVMGMGRWEDGLFIAKP
jgi:hypothetical protein